MTAALNRGDIPVLGGDVVCRNAGGTAIAAGLGVLFDTSHLNTGDLAPAVALPTNGGGVVGSAGITVDAIPAGGTGRVRFLGAYPVTAYGSITYGTTLQIADTTAHLGQVKTCVATVEQIGQAMNGASDGEPVLVWIAKAKNS